MTYLSEIFIRLCVIRKISCKFATQLQTVFDFMDTQPEIPQGRTREEIQQREKLIKDFYASSERLN